MEHRATEGRQRVSFRLLKGWASLAVSVIYPRLEVTGASRLPADAPAILAANHSNALADVAVILAGVPGFPRFLAAASWWKRAPARLLFRLGGVVPVHRRRDGVDTRHNESSFDECTAALADGARLAIFPEGEMHLEPRLLPLRTGAARIALGAVRDAGLRDVAIVPVGLAYADRGRVRSQAELHVGEPIRVADWCERADLDPAAATTARALTDLLADRLGAVTVNHASPEESGRVAQAAAWALVDESEDPSRVPFARCNAVRRALAAALDDAGRAGSEGSRALEVAVEAHRRDLAQLGPMPSVLSLEPVAPELRTRLRRELAALTPLALLGMAANGPVVLALGLASGRVPHESWQATVKGVGGTLLAPVVWGLELALVRRHLGRRGVLVAVLAGPIGAASWLAWCDRWRQRRAHARVAEWERERPEALAAARASRAAVRAQVVALVGDETL